MRVIGYGIERERDASCNTHANGNRVFSVTYCHRPSGALLFIL